jgi:hypothetical protein
LVAAARMTTAMAAKTLGKLASHGRRPPVVEPRKAPR